MKIISNFKDYYDGVQSYGTDTKIVYLRFKVEEMVKDASNWHRSYPGLPCFKSFHLFVCGKIYTGISIYDTSTQKGAPNKWVHFYDKEQAREYILRTFEEKKQRNDTVKYPRWAYEHLINEAVDHFGPQDNMFGAKDKGKDETLKRICMNENVPVGAYLTETNYSSYIIKDCCLKEFGFMKVMDPYTIYQELSMYVGGLAFPGNPTVKISDKDMAVKKGFGHKYAFRKEPGK